jgi:methylmalonyl-CoA mutase
LDLYRRRGHEGAAATADLNADPLGAAVAGEALDVDAEVARAAALAGEVAANWPGIVTLLADGRPYHAGGASEAQELACAVATAIAYLRALERAGLPPALAARQIGVALAVDADFFLGVAKLRALRRLWGRVLELVGAVEAMPVLRLHAETATRMFSRRDPHVNILRATVAAFAAAAGGARSVTVLPFDHALGLPDAFARRIARNTQLVLLEESNLARVIDPAGGSWYVEALTEELAQKAWAIVQEIERHGGMAAALRAGVPQGLVARSWDERRTALATRREPVTGVSEFPDLEETPHRPAPAEVESLVADARARLAPPVAAAAEIAPIPAHRLAEPFERLRDRSDAILARTGERPRVFLCNLGRLAEFGARATFAKNLFEAGGFEAVMGEPMASLEEVGHAFKASGARQAAICSSDENYAAMAESAARALKHAHGLRVYLMGRPDEAHRPAWQAAGVDEFVHTGADVLATLQRAHAIEAGEAEAAA